MWRTYIQLDKTFENKVVDYETIGINGRNSAAVINGFIADKEPEIKNYASNHSPQDDTVENIATSWGFNVLDIPGDGNCFFTAVAFHVHQLISNRSSESSMVRNHVESIGITGDQTIPCLAKFLRRLVVEEWTGAFRSEYQAFLTNVAIEDEAHAFLTDGHYSTSLGDAMPLAMANVLRLPLLIFTQGNLVPVVTVFPRYNVDCIPPLPLAYINDGPGHCDVLIPAEHFPSDSSANNGSKTAGKAGDKTASISPSQNTKLNRRQGNYCRCSINKNRTSSKKSLRKYKSRCGCIIHSLKCSPNCRCKGVRGGTACKEEETIQDSSPKS